MFRRSASRRTGSHPGWPVALGPLMTRAGAVTVRSVRMRDARTWSSLRIRNQTWLVPWEPTGEGAWTDRHHITSWPPLHAVLRREARAGSMVPMAIDVNGRFSGQLTVGNIQRGALRNGWIGYWVDHELAGQGVATAAVALGVDHCFGPVGLHRLEATVQPANLASQAVLTKAGFRIEGMLRRYMDVDGGWRDHLLFAITSDEAGPSAADALVRSGRAAYPQI